jgi:signal transduction histidine kinase
MKYLIQNSKFKIQNLFICIILFSTTLHGQISLIDQKKVDSLEQILNTPSLPEDEFYETCEALFLAYAWEDSGKALEYVWKAVRLAEKRKNYYQLGIFYYSAGGAYYKSGKMDSSLYYFEQALTMEEKAKKKGLKGDEDFEFLNVQILIGLGALHYADGKYELALETFFKALKLVEEMEIPYLEATLFSNIAKNYVAMLNKKQAEVYFLKAEKIYREINPLALAVLYIDFGSLFGISKDLEYTEEAHRILSEMQDVSAHYLIQVTSRMADIWLNIPDYNKALEYALQSVEYAKEVKNPYEIAYAYGVLSKCYLKLKRYKDAEATAFRALEIYSNSISFKCDMYEVIAESNIWMKNSAKAIEYFNKTLDAKNEYSNQNFQTSISEMEVKYETEKKENEIARQQNIIARHNMERGMLAGGLLVSVIILGLLWYLLRMRKQHNQVLTEINATKDKFFSIISHDLKNPALAQRDAIQQLEKNINTWNNEELANFCSNLLKSADEEVELLHTLLSWAQIQTGRMSYMPITFDLPAHLFNDISLIRNMAEFKKIILTDNMPKHATVSGDNNMIVTVIRNLLTNAVKFTPVGGEVSLTIEPSANGKLKISVSDTGMGMNAEQIRNLFNLDCIRSSKGTIGEQGNGLGLIVCKELLKKHNSTLFVESAEGKGSTFWFEI